MYVSKYYIIIDNEFNFCFILKNICGAPGGAEKILHYSTHFGVLSMCFFLQHILVMNITIFKCFCDIESTLFLASSVKLFSLRFCILDTTKCQFYLLPAKRGRVFWRVVGRELALSLFVAAVDKTLANIENWNKAKKTPMT